MQSLSATENKHSPSPNSWMSEVTDEQLHKLLSSQGIRNPLAKLTEEQVASFKRDGWVFIPSEQMWSADEFQMLIKHVSEMNSWPEAAGKWMKYFEKNRLKGQPGHDSADEPEKILQRIENFLQFNPELNSLINGPRMLQMVSQLFEEPAVLYKEKINYKLSGGDGFNPHQDVAAGWWMYGQSLHVSVLIGVDEATKENGCLELVRGDYGPRRKRISPDWKEIPKETCDKLKWEMAPTRPGDVVFFDSYVPHRSGPNNTNHPRRVVYTTYAKASEGDFRDRYYADKRKSFPPDIEREAGKLYEYKI